MIKKVMRLISLFFTPLFIISGILSIIAFLTTILGFYKFDLIFFFIYFGAFLLLIPGVILFLIELKNTNNVILTKIKLKYYLLLIPLLIFIFLLREYFIFILAITIIPFLLWIILFIIKKNKFDVKLSLFIFTLLISCFLIFIIIELSDNILYNNQSKADLLIQKIELYKNDKKKYPETLNDLIPNYLNEIPIIKKGFWSSKFNYYLKDNGENFHLHYTDSWLHNPNDYYIFYNTELKRWVIDD